MEGGRVGVRRTCCSFTQASSAACRAWARGQGALGWGLGVKEEGEGGGEGGGEGKGGLGW